MKQAFLEDIDHLVLKEVPKPELERPDQILVRIKAATICGADVHMLRGRHPPNEEKYPSVIGHEGAGIVEVVGDWTTIFKPGDRVATKEWFRGCMAEYTVTTADNLLHIPDEIPFEQAAVLEPLHAVYPLSYQCFQLGETVVIIGQGSVGLLFTQMARASGVYQIIVSEPHAPKRELAKKLGADVVVNPVEEDIVEAVQEATNGEMAHAVIETSGAPQVYPVLASLLQTFGTVGQFGTYTEPIPFDFWGLHTKGLRVLSSWRGPGHTPRIYKLALRLVQRGLVDLGPIVTHRFPLTEVRDAFELAGSGRGDVIKVAVLP